MVEGNIGCGKSTFLRYFQQLSPKNEVMHEPLYLWKDARGYDLFVTCFFNFSYSYRNLCIMINADGLFLFRLRSL